MKIRILLCAAALAATLSGAPNAWAAPAIVDEPTMTGNAASADFGPRGDYALDTEMVVHDWVLCASRALTESLVRAHNDGREAAARAFADLSASHACGRFAELRVILQERIASATRAGSDARGFAALIRVADDWATAYVIAGAVDDGLD